jgi:hypothetical protein
MAKSVERAHQFVGWVERSDTHHNTAMISGAMSIMVVGVA